MELFEIEKRNEEIGNEMRDLIEKQGALTDEQKTGYINELKALNEALIGIKKLNFYGSAVMFWFLVVCSYFILRGVGIL